VKKETLLKDGWDKEIKRTLWGLKMQRGNGVRRGERLVVGGLGIMTQGISAWSKRRKYRSQRKRGMGLYLERKLQTRVGQQRRGGKER